MGRDGDIDGDHLRLFQSIFIVHLTHFSVLFVLHFQYMVSTMTNAGVKAVRKLLKAVPLRSGDGDDDDNADDDYFEMEDDDSDDDDDDSDGDDEVEEENNDGGGGGGVRSGDGSGGGGLMMAMSRGGLMGGPHEASLPCDLGSLRGRTLLEQVGLIG